MADGFGISFYGFFLFSALWCVAYFAWAVRANRREAAARRGRREPGADEPEPEPPGDARGAHR